MAECMRRVASLVAVQTFAICFSSAASASQAANDLFCDIHQPSQNGVLAECSGPFPPGNGGITIELIGTPPNSVTSVRLSRDDEQQPFQTLVLAARPVIDLETVGILFMDMDFDGHPDLAIMKNLATGYRYYLFDPVSRRFAASAELDTIAWPEFDPETKSVRAYRQRADGTTGHDIYRWSDGKLQRVAQ